MEFVQIMQTKKGDLVALFAEKDMTPYIFSQEQLIFCGYKKTVRDREMYLAAYKALMAKRKTIESGEAKMSDIEVWEGFPNHQREDRGRPIPLQICSM